MAVDVAEALHEILLRTGTTIAVAESLTAGQVQVLLGSCSGSSAYFRGGVTAYTLETKVKLLGVEVEHAKQVNCVSDQVARQMAAGVREMFGADIGLATTGYAEPDLGRGVREPFAWIAFNVLDCYWTRRINIYSGESREEAQVTIAYEIIEDLVEFLTEARNGNGHENIPAVATLLNRGL